SGRRHTRFSRDWSSDVCSSDLPWADRRPWRLTRTKWSPCTRPKNRREESWRAAEVVSDSSGYDLSRKEFEGGGIRCRKRSGAPRSEERREGKRVEGGGGRGTKT